MSKTISLDKFLMRSLHAFLEGQLSLYLEDIETRAGDHSPTIDAVQARYEVASLAAATVARFVTQVSHTAQIPAAYLPAAEAFERMICEAGDDHLRALGIDPDRF